PGLAAAYERDFAELWHTGEIRGTGVQDETSATVGTASAWCAFAPGEGPTIDARLGGVVSPASTRVAVAPMVLTSHTILGALADALDHGVAVTGIYDSGQMGPIVKEWERSSTGAATAALFQRVAEHLASKQSEPYHPDGLHNFMHHKVLVCDD